MKLDLTHKEASRVLQRRASDERKKQAGPKLQPQKRQAPSPDADADFMGWLHDGLPCIACLRLGRAPRDRDIEAAHQKLNVAARNWHKRAGRRGPHRQCVPLCQFHHRTGTPCCDPAQAKFWLTVGFEPETVVDFAEALFAAYEADEPGAPVVARFAALPNRPEGQ